MTGQETIEDLKEQIAAQTRLSEERLLAIEASRNNTGRLEEAPANDQPPSGFEGAGSREQAGFTKKVVEESPPTVCCELLKMRLRLQGVAVSP